MGGNLLLVPTPTIYHEFGGSGGVDWVAPRESRKPNTHTAEQALCRNETYLAHDDTSVGYNSLQSGAGSWHRSNVERLEGETRLIHHAAMRDSH